MPPSRRVKGQVTKWEQRMGKPGRARHTQAAFSARMVSMVRRYSWGYLGLAIRRMPPRCVHQLGHPACPQGQDGVELLHHADVVQVHVAGAGTSPRFQRRRTCTSAGRGSRGRMPAASQGGPGVVQHGGHLPPGGQGGVLLAAGGPPFFRARVWTVRFSGARAMHLVQGLAEALPRVSPGRPAMRSMLMARPPHLPGQGIGPADVRRPVAAADGRQHGVGHGLGVHGDPVAAPGAGWHRQLFPA